MAFKSLIPLFPLPPPPHTPGTWKNRLAGLCAAILSLLCFTPANFAHAADPPAIAAAQGLIEQYFTAEDSPHRRAIIAQLQVCGVDPPTLGRLCHNRQSWTDLPPGVYYINEKAGLYPVKYFLGVPRKYTHAKPWPLMVMLPTANAFVSDPPPTGDQIAHFYSLWINEELARHPDALVLMPLLNLTELYGPGYQGVATVIQPILNVAGKVNVDPARVYMVGQSMAAHAIWNIALHYPTYFAAINPLGGGADAPWQRLRMMNLRNVLPVVWADSDDPVIPVRQSRDLVQELRGLKLDVVYDQTVGAGHLPPPELVEQDYQKMRARVRELYPPHVSIQSNRPDAIFNRVDWIQVYQQLNPGPDLEVYLMHGAGQIHVNQNAYTVDAQLDANTVKMTTTNVDSLRLYFNDQMVDFSKPLVVIVNGKQRFNALLQPSIDEMMKDQLFLGRGWRYFTAVVDLELGYVPPPPLQSTRPASTTRPRGRIIEYNDDGTVRKIIESP